MARHFASGSNQYLEGAHTLGGLSWPMALCGWLRADNATGAHVLCSCGDSATDVNYYYLAARGDAGGDPIRCRVNISGDSMEADTSAGFSASTWTHAAAAIVGSEDLRVWINGGNEGNDNTAMASFPASLDNFAVGRLTRKTPWNPTNAAIAEVAAFDLSVYPGATDADKADHWEDKILPGLAAGWTPDHFPLGLVAYYPLGGLRNRVDKDYLGAYDLTPYNAPTWVDHPGLIYPTPALFCQPDAAGPTTVSPAAASSTWSVPAATVTKVATPAPAASTWSVPAATLTKIATPAPAASTWSVPAATVTKIATPAPAASTWSVPAATVTKVATPAPAASTWSVPAATLTKVATPAPAASTWSVPAATLTKVATPAPAAPTWSVPAATLTKVATPAPAASTWSVPAPTLTKIATPAPAASTWSALAGLVRVLAEPAPAASTWSVPAPTLRKLATPAPAASIWSVPTPTTAAGSAVAGPYWIPLRHVFGAGPTAAHVHRAGNTDHPPPHVHAAGADQIRLEPLR